MKVAKHKTQPRRSDVNLRMLGVASYGERNEYPEKVMEIVASSSTGSGCLDTSQRFVFGDGYTDQNLAEYPVNRRGHTANKVLKKVVEDKMRFNGFAVHVNYNGLLEAVEIQHVPFEHCRVSVDAEGNPDGFIAVHADWTRRNRLYRKPVNKDTIEFYPVFNTEVKTLLKQVRQKGGINNYSGQILYYSEAGDLEYPLAPFDDVITDMATEEAISTVLFRNARHNFLPAGLIIRKRRPQSTTLDNEEGEREEDDLATEITNWQGDERAAKMIVVETEYDEEEPKFVPFPVQNFDRMFDKTSTYIEAKIGKRFMQPPILRAVDIGAGWGAELMKNAYDYYNSIVESDRKTIESELKKIYETTGLQFTDYSIKPLQYQLQVNENRNDQLDNEE